MTAVPFPAQPLATRRRGRPAWLAAALVLFAASAWPAPAAAAGGEGARARHGFFETQVEGKVGFDQRLGEPLPLDVVLTDEAGRRLPLGALFGQRPLILTFVYYKCTMLCPLVLDGVSRVLRPISLSAGEAFDVAVVSINPRETPAQAAARKVEFLARYDRPGAAAGIHFLTGTEEAIRELTAAAGFRYSHDPASDEYAHAAGILIATPQGRIARYYYGIDFSPRDVRLGLVEAASHTIGTALDQVLLLCFHYDPATGTYGVVVMNIMRAAAALTVLAVAVALLLMFRRDRRAAPAAGGAN